MVADRVTLSKRACCQVGTLPDPAALLKERRPNAVFGELVEYHRSELLSRTVVEREIDDMSGAHRRPA
jgi:hypothetical protein